MHHIDVIVLQAVCNVQVWRVDGVWLKQKWKTKKKIKEKIRKMKNVKNEKNMEDIKNEKMINMVRQDEDMNTLRRCDGGDRPRQAKHWKTRHFTGGDEIDLLFTTAMNAKNVRPWLPFSSAAVA